MTQRIKLSVIIKYKMIILLGNPNKLLRDLI